ncbi:HD domain-containing protein [Candidatus Woesearchaeota archaeon]|nr:HD domain-containing protein [Candidatus Woesearchaeota archaeon]
MKTKNEHTTRLLPQEIHPITELFFEYAQLKNLYRQGWLERGVSEKDCETVAEHSFGVALLSYIIAEEYRPDLDSSRVMRLGLFHDVSEIYAGDITPKDGVSLEDKSQREYEAVKRVFSRLPNPHKYVNIWLEFEKHASPEAKFVSQIDRLEMVLQANLYERMNYAGLDEFFSYIQGRTNCPELKPILDDILKSR